MLVELQYMHTIPRMYRKLHIVIRFNEYFDNFFELSIQRIFDPHTLYALC